MSQNTNRRHVNRSNAEPVSRTRLSSERRNGRDYGSETTGARSLLQSKTAAPNFVLNSTPDQRLDLNEFRGRPVILAFYPADWSPVCGDQLALYNEILDEFGKFNAQLLGISVDGVWSHAAYAMQRKLHFPLLADFEPKGNVARNYGAYRHADGVCERALFVVDPNGIVQWSYLSPLGVNPGADGILTALESLQSSSTQKVNHFNKAKETPHAQIT